MNPVDARRGLPSPPENPEATPAVDEMLIGDIDSLRVLVVDDEPTLRSVVSQVLSMDGHDVTEAACAEDALAAFRASPFSLVITDVVMGRMSGLELLREIKTLDPEALVVIMTSYASLETATTALREGAYDFLIKPFEELVLVSALADRARDRLRLQARNRLLMAQLKAYAGELERLNARLKEMADRDGLTGLFNHRYLRHALDVELATALKHKRALSLFLLDVDHFKRYNDTHGHLAGDELLRDLGRILPDSAGLGAVCARYGGEEFAVILPGVDRKGALARAESVRRRVEEHAPGGSAGSARLPRGSVTVSVGVSCYPEDGTDDQTLIDHADSALYRAKHAGRNLVRA